MKVALVSYDAFQGMTTGLCPPLHLCKLATALGAAGIETRVFDYAMVGEYHRAIVALVEMVAGKRGETDVPADRNGVANTDCRMPDDRILAWAVCESRVIITTDLHSGETP